MVTGTPGSIAVECPVCGEETRHTVIKGKLSEKNGAIRFEGTVKCTECGSVHQASIKESAPIRIRTIVSEGEESYRSTISLPPEELLMVGDEFMHEGIPVRITAIEIKDKRVDRAHASDIETIWLKKFDHVDVRFSINKGDRTVSKKISAEPDEEFIIGDYFMVDRDYVVIHKIKATYGFVENGSVLARDIIRVYGKKIRR